MKRNSKKIGRRNFVKTAAAGAFGYLLLSGVEAAPKKTGANDKLAVAFIGAGGRGAAHVSDLLGYDKVAPVAFCDVDQARCAETLKLAPKLPLFADYRAMFDKIGKQIDAVIISAPDHVHYPIATWALAAGKHIYLEKPMTRTIWESRKLRDYAAETGLVTQLGNQGHGYGWWRDVYEWYRAGVFGEVVEMHNWTDRPIWNQGPFGFPDGSEKAPPTLDYKLWLNVAPDTPYSEQFVPFHWRGFRYFGTGAMGDHACHSFDWFYSGLDLGMPRKVKTVSGKYSEFGWPRQTRTTFEFAPKNGRPAVKLEWYDNAQKPGRVERLAPKELAKMSNGGAIVGTKETVICYNQYGRDTRVTPRERMIELKKSNALPPQTLPRIKQTHERNFVDACLEGKRAESDIASYAAKLNEFVLLGAVSTFFSGMELEYDDKLGKFTNCSEANEFFMSRYKYKKEFLVSEKFDM
ncbi:MAG: Gfo/Idh/MocA family oxidoreductase [Opitutales bacterium]|nr:Gfo/Idh/MocA family oxidoreductase [Opitutales bacterium]